MESKNSKVVRGIPLSQLLCPSVEGVIHDLFPIVRSWVEDGNGEIVLPRDWDLVFFFLKTYRPWLKDELDLLTHGERLVVFRRIEGLLADEAKERRRIKFLRLWFWVKVWVCAIGGLGLIAAWANGWAWVWWALTGVRI